MGVFFKNKKNGKAKPYKELLVSVGIDIDSFKYEDFDPEEISIDDELAGVIRKSGKVLEGDVDYNIIDLTENNDGKKELSLFRYADEYAVKDLVNTFISVFGPDDSSNKEFSCGDLDIIRHTGFNTIRKWVSDVNSEYNVTLSYSPDNGLLNVCIL